jgi:phosphate:Na+ symporter
MMEDINVNINALVAIFTALVLFLFAIESFGKELEHTFKDKLRPWIQKATQNSFLSLLTGTLVTGLIQSSSAVSVICVSLVGAGSMNLQQAIGILLGSKVGTTLTAQLIAFKLTNIAPYFLVGGYLLNIAKGKVGIWGKPLFYFGLLFFCLNLLSQEVSAFKDHPFVVSWLTNVTNPYLGLFAGFVITALLQSSSVMSGLLIIFASEGLIQVEFAIPMIIGSSIGTTITAFLASFPLGPMARKTAIANFLINIIGVIVFIPFLLPFTSFMVNWTDSIPQQLANASLTYNLITAMMFLPFYKRFTQYIDVKFQN